MEKSKEGTSLLTIKISILYLITNLKNFAIKSYCIFYFYIVKLLNYYRSKFIESFRVSLRKYSKISKQQVFSFVHGDATYAIVVSHKKAGEIARVASQRPPRHGLISLFY